MTLDPATSRESLIANQQHHQPLSQPPFPPNPAGQPQEQTQNESSEAPTKPIVGIIYPPPEHRNIIDKTAMFVARNGRDFEDKVRQNEVANSKFNFFNPTDPYHAYYQHKIKEFREGKVQDITPIHKPTPSSAVLAQQEKIKQQVVAEMSVPKEAPPDYEFVADPPTISGQELDVVKLTAQFVARNGRHFLTQLMNREQRNPQFDFLRPQHGMFQYFTKLVEQYTKVLIPPKDLIDMLERQSISIDPMVDEVKRRADWRKHIEKQKQREADELERERVAYGQIDWHDFVIVETVDFQSHETLGLPPPVTPSTVGARVIHQQRVDEKKRMGIEEDNVPEPTESATQSVNAARQGKEGGGGQGTGGVGGAVSAAEEGGADMDLDDMEESDDEGGEGDEEEEEEEPEDGVDNPQNARNQPAIQPISVGGGGEDLLIRKDYDPKLKPSSSSGAASQLPNYVINEITGERVPIDKMNQHVKYNLLDPRWLEEKERQQREKQQQEEVFAIGNQIGNSLKQLAERRTDIFGAGDEETLIGRKLGEEEDGGKRDERAIWDGHTGSVESTTKRIQANITIQDQIEAIHKAKGLAEDAAKEKIGPQIMGATDNMTGAVSSASNEMNTSKDSGMTSMSGLSSTQMRSSQMGSSATPLLVPIVPVVQRPPMVPVFNANPAAAMLGAIQQQNLAVALAAQQAGIAAAVAEKSAQAQAAAAAASTMNQSNQGAPGNTGPPGTSQASSSSVINEDLMGPSAAKRAKGESDLIPESVFLQSRKSPLVTVNITVPKDYSKPEWNLNGQTICMTLPYRDCVSVIKEKISEQLTLPAGKQKLVYEGIFIKDSNTLAFYNMTDSCSILLQLKERGGRKK